MRLLGHHPRTLCGIASALGTRGNAIECPWVEGSYRGEAVYRFLLRPAYSILTTMSGWTLERQGFWANAIMGYCGCWGRSRPSLGGLTGSLALVGLPFAREEVPRRGAPLKSNVISWCIKVLRDWSWQTQLSARKQEQGFNLLAVENIDRQRIITSITVGFHLWPGLSTFFMIIFCFMLDLDKRSWNWFHLNLQACCFQASEVRVVGGG